MKDQRMTTTTTALADGEEAAITAKFTLVHAPGAVTLETRNGSSDSGFAELAATEVAPDVYLLDPPNGQPTVRVTGGAATVIGIS